MSGQPGPPGPAALTGTGQDPQPAPGPPKPAKIPAGPRQPAPGPGWLRALLRASPRPR